MILNLYRHIFFSYTIQYRLSCRICHIECDHCNTDSITNSAVNCDCIHEDVCDKKEQFFRLQ